MAVDVDRKQSFVQGFNIAGRIPISPCASCRSTFTPSFPSEIGGFVLFMFFLFPLLSRKNDLAYTRFVPFEGGTGCFEKRDYTSAL